VADTDEIKAKAEALAQVAMKLGQAIYEKDQQRRPAGREARGETTRRVTGGRRRRISRSTKT